ncbi:MAG: hypothetical protein U5M50_09935 [Sphingobium sp.]|nr:hypothetical protein [Sphingobium sp.]
MSFQKAIFQQKFIAQGRSPNSAKSYVSYLNRADALIDGIDELLRDKGAEIVVGQLERLPDRMFGGTKQRRDCLSSIRPYVKLADEPAPVTVPETRHITIHQLPALVQRIRDVALEYYQVTGKPLGVTGELAELAAAEILGVVLSDARQAGYDAIDHSCLPPRRVQIKGRAINVTRPYIGRCPSIKCGGLFDDVLLVLLDKVTLKPFEIWRSTEADVIQRLNAPGSKARNERSSMGISQFRSIAKCVWRSSP